MDPVTHLLTGACLSRAGLNRKTGLATLTLTLATEAPDLDIIAYLGGSVTGFQHHRGFTHSLLGAAATGALTVAVVYGIYRATRSLRRQPKISANWPLLFAYAWLGGLVHLFQDFTNNYGVRPFAPFNLKWYSWDSVFIIDPLMLLALFLGLVVPGVFGLVSDEVGAAKPKFRGRGGAGFALVCLAVLIFARDFEHRRAVTALKSLTYQGHDALRVSAFPNPIDLFAWNGLVETQDAFELLPVDSKAGEVDPHNLAVIRYKPQETPVTLAAKKSRLGRVFLDWAQYPWVQTKTMEGGRTLVTFTDLRFSSAESLRRRLASPLTGYVVLDRQLRVEGQGMGRPPD